MGTFYEQKNGFSENTSGNSFSLHLVLFSDADEMYELWLPAVSEGIYYFADLQEHSFLSVAAKEGQWFAICKEPACFRNVAVTHQHGVLLVENQTLFIEFENRTYRLYVSKASKEFMVCHNYSVCRGTEISIGSLPGNDIYCSDPHISRNHAMLIYSEKGWYFWDCDSLNGTYVNGMKRNNSMLNLGDVIRIMGLRIIIGTSFLSISDDTGTVTVSQKLQRISSAENRAYEYTRELTSNSESYFNRLPRKRIEMIQKTITIEGPPMSTERKQLPLMLRMGSSMVMGGASALAGNYTTVLSSVLFPLLSSKYTEKERQEYERLRVEKYTEYLEKKYQEILEACWNEQNILNLKYPSLQEIISCSKQTQHLWERRPVDRDFLHIRLGIGSRPLSAVVNYPTRRFELEEDELEEKMYQLAEQPYCLEDVPVVLSLVESTVCGLTGQHETVCAYIRQMVLQLAVLHSYDELKIVFLMSPEELKHMESVRYLPHTWSNRRDFRLIATNEAEAYALGEYLEGQFCEDDGKDFQQILKCRPYYLIIAMDKRLSENHKILKDIAQSDKNHGVSLIVAYDDLPKETQRIIALSEHGKSICTTMSTDGGDDIFFEIESYDAKEAERMMGILANTRLKTVTQAQEIPKMITFLEMYKAGRIEQLNPLKRWRENNPAKSLMAPVGIGADGMLFTLDLHEKRQGPHGLVAGMTGSGKSEFIITYILSMAVNYHPDEVAFVLIDYKGGGLAGAFENPHSGVRLPHLVGTITNLDGASIQRSLMSIESELIRRQRIFNEVKSVVNEGTMDIYTYQRLYREGRVAEPMPHLFIISDEFAELKQQQPEFMDKLISAARIGRSLGVHLILATQKPSGVVNDQIRSNTKFRVCLRVQERSDSMDMLKRPEAAELTDTGRFYLQVGYNEYFAMGQSAWCGAPYEPQDTVAVRRDNAVEFLDAAGQAIMKAQPEVKKTDSGMKQIVAVVKYLAELAQAQGIRSRPLWQLELPKSLDLDAINQEYCNAAENPFCVCAGMVDDPEQMTQFPMMVDFLNCQNILIVGDSGSGKTTVVQNILYSLSEQLPPQDFNFYALDYSSRMLKLFKPLPHCGAVLQEEDSESLDEFFKLINSIVSERKKIFSDLGIDKFEIAREYRKLPLILVVIDNITGLSSSKAGESQSYQLQSYLKNCANYGVKYVITCSHLNEVSSRIRQELPERISLHIKDKYDYGEVLGCKVNYIPPDIPGRGLYKPGEKPLEFQGAVMKAKANEVERLTALKERITRIAERSGRGGLAQRMAVVAEDVEFEEFASQFAPGRVPLGYYKACGKPIALPLKQFSKMSIFFGNPSGKQPIWHNFVHVACREDMELIILRSNRESCFEDGDTNWAMQKTPAETTVLPINADNLDLLLQALNVELSKRNMYIDNYCTEHNVKFDGKNLPKQLMDALLEETNPVMVLIESFGDFCAMLNKMPTYTLISYVNTFKSIRQRNIYIVAGFEPDLPENVTSNLLFKDFNLDSDQLLLGGCLDKLNTCNAEVQSDSGGQMWPYNTGIMRYRGKFYPISIPCGSIEEIVSDEDLRDIFEG